MTYKQKWETESRETSSKIVKSNGFSRALNTFAVHAAMNVRTSLSAWGNEINAHLSEQSNVERWQERSAELQRHNTFK